MNFDVEKKKCNKCNLFKRLLLLVEGLPILYFIDIFSYFYENDIFLIYASILGTYIFLLNFPYLIKILNTEIDTIDSLIDSKTNIPILRKRYQMVFILLSQFFLSFTIGGVTYYYINMEDTPLTPLEYTGVIGGFISLLSELHGVVSNIIMICLSKLKKSNIELSPRRVSVLHMLERITSMSVSNTDSIIHSADDLDEFDLDKCLNANNNNNTSNQTILNIMKNNILENKSNNISENEINNVLQINNDKKNNNIIENKHNNKILDKINIFEKKVNNVSLNNLSLNNVSLNNVSLNNSSIIDDDDDV